MCGIAGLITQASREDALKWAAAMALCMAHRGPDDGGVESFRLAGDHVIALAHRRLSILDLSSAGHQPMSLDGGRLWLTYNGEIYNYIELRDELKALGRRFISGTDTEVLLHAYDEWGVDCLRRFNGMWSFAIWDSLRQSLFCATDISGIKPFHYLEGGHGFAFASEIKALLELPWAARSPDQRRSLLFLLSSVDCVDEQTLFAGVRRLLPGHAMIVRPGVSARKWRWWDAREIDVPKRQQELDELFLSTLRDSIKLRFRSDVPVGIALSGGVDSSAILFTAADMAKRGELNLTHGFRSFTATTAAAEVNEGPAATAAARQCGAISHQVRPEAQALVETDLERLVWHQDEPFPSLSIYMQYCVARLTRSTGTPVILSGQGPDELFWGYPWQYPYLWRDLMREGHPLSAAVEMFQALRHGTVGAKKLLSYAGAAWLPGLRSWRYRRRAEPFLQPDALRGKPELLFAPLVARESGRDLHEREVSRQGLPALMRYEDRNSMAFSVESRVPFLDPRLLDLAFAIPSSDRIRGGWSKALVRRAASAVVPASIAWKRRKIGFAAPDADFGQALAPWAQAMFSEDAASIRSSPLVRPVAVHTELRNDPLAIGAMWRFLSFEAWMRRFRLSF